VQVDVALLRHGVAAALCTAQALPVPRSEMDRMIMTLLRTAFDLLDDASGVERELAVRVAAHALVEWRAFYVDGLALAFAAARR
jgi:hypothetical protein